MFKDLFVDVALNSTITLSIVLFGLYLARKEQREIELRKNTASPESIRRAS